MTTRTVYWDRGLPELGKPLQQEWLTWITRHGLPDVSDLPLFATLICDDTNRTVTFEQWPRNEHGKHWLEPDPDRAGEDRMVREWVTLQLEAPALPLPDGYRISIDA